MSDMIENLHRRMDTQDALLLEIRDKVVAHLSAEQEMKPALDELVSLWKGSKVISRILAALFAAGAALWALFVWAKDHIK
jgi:hypothetical protein